MARRPHRPVARGADCIPEDMRASVSRRRFLGHAAAGLSARRAARPGAGAARDRKPPPSRRTGRIFAVTAPVCDRGQRAADPLVRSARPRAHVRFGSLEYRSGLVLTSPLSRLRRAVGLAARRQRRALHRDQRQGQLVHRPHPLSRPRDDRARRRRGRADARTRRPADHRARLVRFRVDRARRHSRLCRARARQPGPAFRFQQGLYPRARRGGAAAAGARRSCPTTRGWRRW